MKEPHWLNREDALAVHEMMLAQHGGLVGVRDQGLLDSALAKAKNKFGYGPPSMTEMAAAYTAGIILNHPFLDGNKRTGFVLAVAFLELNGFEFNASEADVVERTLALAARAIGEADYANFLAKNCRRVRS